ncbi:3-dehydroquinate synthase [Corynebacterium mayonis]|uniref:3-dehydroquinate synthase n=1 Tax=Corynebacterium mayonis TaxID=3062461 RepID=UPI00314012CD
MAVVRVEGPSPYSVLIGRNLHETIAKRVREIGARNVAIVHQGPLGQVAQDVAAAVGEVAHVVLLPIPDAEAGKTSEVLGGLWDALGEAGFGRQDAVIGLGGGAVTDVAGFAAATWMRGISVIQVPTTLLAMVDAAVGGKTGINTVYGKNLVGAFHEPDSVFIDLERLDTLDSGELIAGSAELIKTGFIADPRILELFREGADEHWEELIRRSVQVKASVVSQDLKESGLREILNYGHTFGHAIERRENYTWRHGDAVAVGMMFVAHLAHGRGLIDDSLLALHHEILSLVGLPTSYQAGVFDELYEAMTMDKKNRDGEIRFVVLDSLGHCTRLEDASVAELRAAYEVISGGVI